MAEVVTEAELGGGQLYGPALNMDSQAASALVQRSPSAVEETKGVEEGDPALCASSPVATERTAFTTAFASNTQVSTPRGLAPLHVGDLVLSPDLARLLSLTPSLRRVGLVGNGRENASDAPDGLGSRHLSLPGWICGSPTMTGWEEQLAYLVRVGSMCTEGGQVDGSQGAQLRAVDEYNQGAGAQGTVSGTSQDQGLVGEQDPNVQEENPTAPPGESGLALDRDKGEQSWSAHTGGQGGGPNPANKSGEGELAGVVPPEALHPPQEGGTCIPGLAVHQVQCEAGVFGPPSITVPLSLGPPHVHPDPCAPATASLVYADLLLAAARDPTILASYDETAMIDDIIPPVSGGTSHHPAVEGIQLMPAEQSGTPGRGNTNLTTDFWRILMCSPTPLKVRAVHPGLLEKVQEGAEVGMQDALASLLSPCAAHSGRHPAFRRLDSLLDAISGAGVPQAGEVVEEAGGDGPKATKRRRVAKSSSKDISTVSLDQCTPMVLDPGLCQTDTAVVVDIHKVMSQPMESQDLDTTRQMDQEKLCRGMAPGLRHAGMVAPGPAVSSSIYTRGGLQGDWLPVLWPASGPLYPGMGPYLQQRAVALELLHQLGRPPPCGVSFNPDDLLTSPQGKVKTRGSVGDEPGAVKVEEPPVQGGANMDGQGRNASGADTITLEAPTESAAGVLSSVPPSSGQEVLGDPSGMPVTGQPDAVGDVHAEADATGECRGAGDPQVGAGQSMTVDDPSNEIPAQKLTETGGTMDSTQEGEPDVAVASGSNSPVHGDALAPSSLGQGVGSMPSVDPVGATSFPSGVGVPFASHATHLLTPIHLGPVLPSGPLPPFTSTNLNEQFTRSEAVPSSQTTPTPLPLFNLPSTTNVDLLNAVALQQHQLYEAYRQNQGLVLCSSEPQPQPQPPQSTMVEAMDINYQHQQLRNWLSMPGPAAKGTSLPFVSSHGASRPVSSPQEPLGVELLLPGAFLRQGLPLTKPPLPVAIAGAFPLHIAPVAGYTGHPTKDAVHVESGLPLLPRYHPPAGQHSKRSLGGDHSSFHALLDAAKGVVGTVAEGGDDAAVDDPQSTYPKVTAAVALGQEVSRDGLSQEAGTSSRGGRGRRSNGENQFAQFLSSSGGSGPPKSTLSEDQKEERRKMLNRMSASRSHFRRKNEMLWLQQQESELKEEVEALKARLHTAHTSLAQVVADQRMVVAGCGSVREARARHREAGATS